MPQEQDDLRNALEDFKQHSDFYESKKDSPSKHKVDADALKTKNLTLTQGELLVGLSFNPSKDPRFDKAKRLFAELADMVFNDQRVTYEPGLSQLITDAALQQLLLAQMAVVKYLTWDK